jgi:hypothetical protein
MGMLCYSVNKWLEDVYTGPITLLTYHGFYFEFISFKVIVKLSEKKTCSLG